MKRYLSLGMLIILFLAFAGCKSNQNPSTNTDLSRETWQSQIQTNPSLWARGASRWFLTGDPSPIEIANRKSPYTSAISTMMVRVPNFTNIKVNGSFQVQIFGTYDNNSVYIYGPNDAVRQTTVLVSGNTLIVGQSKTVPVTMRRVIVRIGIRNLNNLTNLGCASIEAIQIHSNSLNIRSAGRGNIYLGGRVNLKNVTSSGTGSVNVFNAVTPSVEVTTSGGGNVNIAGNVGISCIRHSGGNDINIVGANTDLLKIYASGAGKIGINGTANLRELRATDNVRVFLSRSLSDNITAYLYKSACVGIAGCTTNLAVNTYQNAHFMCRYLCVQNAFVRAHDRSHINVAANGKIFASATEQASVYFYGMPTILSQFVSGNGTVIPMWGSYVTNGCTVGAGCVRAAMRDYKGERISVNRERSRNWRNQKTTSYKVDW